MNFEGGDQADEILRSEWARSRARSRRAREEVELLVEEMRRVLVFLLWRAKWWENQQDVRPGADFALVEGVRAYALKQGGVQRSLAASFQALWKTRLATVDDAVLESGGVVAAEGERDSVGGDIDADDDENDNAGDENCNVDIDEGDNADENVQRQRRQSNGRQRR